MLLLPGQSPLLRLIGDLLGVSQCLLLGARSGVALDESLQQEQAETPSILRL
jgi:hypothetical protein